MTAPAALVPERERGQSLVTSIAAIAVFLGFLLFAVHICVNLYAETTVTANAYDAARRVARAEVAGSDRRAAIAIAKEDLRENMGRFASRITYLDIRVRGDDVVELEVHVDRPSFLIFEEDLGGGPLGELKKTVRVRVERVR